MKFQLDKDQKARLKEWQEKIKKKYGQYGDYQFMFEPTGIGDIVTVISKLTGDELDLSDVDNW